MADIKDFAHQRLSQTDLTVQELLAIVEQIVDERLSTERLVPKKATAEWWQSMVDGLVELEPGAPSPTALLQEERDQWYKP